MTAKSQFEEELGALTVEVLTKDYRHQHEALMSMTALVGELFIDGERKKAYDLFNNASKAFGMYAMMTGVAFVLVDKDMKFTPTQLELLLTYASLAAEKHDKYHERAINMAQVFVDELKLDPKVAEGDI